VKNYFKDLDSIEKLEFADWKEWDSLRVELAAGR
jgi:hypothetical protein